MSVQTNILRHKLGVVMAEGKPQIEVIGYFYAVDLGEGVQPRHHRVGKNAICSCQLADLCPAVDAVRAHLAAGGEHPPEPPPGYYPVIPHKCPICGAAVSFDQSLSSKRRGAGWRCSSGGTGHYWQRMGQCLKEKFAANPWLFPPVVLRGKEKERVLAYDGIAPNDQVLYPGVLRADVMTT